MVCLVWVYKWLCILLYSNNKRVVVLIDHKAIYGIINAINLNILSTDYINRRLINASVYLLIYLFDIYYISRQLNFIPDMLFYLRILEDDTIRADETIEPTLDII